MMIVWMLAAVLFTLCVGVAATAAERLLRAYGRGARSAWIVALAVAVTWPVIVPVVGPYFASSELGPTSELVAPVASSANELVIAPDNSAGVWSRVVAMQRVIEIQTRRVSMVLLANSSWLNPMALTMWLMLSTVLLLRLLVAALHVRQLTRRATPSVVDGNEVLLAEGFGPASVGWRTPRVVVPQWVLALDTPLRALVLRHETEHCRSRDPRFVWCAAIATAVMPWNAGLWWLARRLRLALELDCDVRTLQDGGDPRTYAKLLLFMTQQHAAPAAHLRLASSLAGSRSHLATRITAMQENSKLMSRGARLAAAGVAILAVIGACATRIPGNIAAPNTPLPDAPELSVAAVESVTVAPTPVENADGKPYFEFQVEKPASMRRGSVGLRYPEMLRSAQVEGSVLASFVVDERGVADMSTFKMLRSDHELFTHSVRVALPEIRYEPAEVGGMTVKQVVQQPFVFSLPGKASDMAAPSTTSPDKARAGAQALAQEPAIARSGQPSPPRTVDAGAPYFEFQVEKPAGMVAGTNTMTYPVMLRSAQVEGAVLASFVVGTDGRVDMSTFKVLNSDHELFTMSVRNALPELRFNAAEVGGQRVKQLVQQPFVFQLAR